jgi:hypothetical protein
MKKLTILVLGMTLAVPAFSAGQHHASGKPAQTGLERAETKANAHGERGIENAEGKQAKDKKSGKKLAKGKSKVNKNKHTSQ